MNKLSVPDQSYQKIHDRIAGVIETARSAAARSDNRLMTATYWEIGRRIVSTEQGGQARAEYGEALVERLAADFTGRFGRGFSRQNLWQMKAFHLCWPAERILQTMSGESAQGRPCTIAALLLSSVSTRRHQPSGYGSVSNRPGNKAQIKRLVSTGEQAREHS